MAISWGTFDGHLIVGCEAVRDGADAIFRWYVGIDGWNYNDNQVLTYGGAISGSTAFHNGLTVGGHSSTDHGRNVTDYMQVSTVRVTGSPGAVKTASGTLSGSYLAGETPTKTVSITLANIPATPAAPSVTGVTQSAATVNMVYPANNGNVITQTRFFIYDVATGGTAVASYAAIPAATSHNFTGLASGTNFWADVSATNGIGTTVHSARTPFSTGTLTAPSRPVIGVASSVTQTTATITGTAPAANGSTITGYEFQVSLSSSFSPLRNDVTQAGLVLNLTGMTGNTHHFVRYRANSTNGPSDWSPTLDFVTDPTVPNTPAKPTLDSTASDGTATFSWPAAGNGGSAITGYTFQVDESDFATPLYNNTANTLTRSVPSLPVGVPLLARVRATNAIGTGAWSATLSFALSPGGDIIIGDGGDFVQGQFFFNNYGEWIQLT